MDAMFGTLLAIDNGNTLVVVLLHMQVITSMTQKGQVTIPKYWRDKLDLKPYDSVKIVGGDGFVKVLPNEDILDMAGELKAKKGKTALKAREEMEKDYARV